jgi:hypothetical protein
MARISNPRFPHTCRILRYAVKEPMEDQANVLDPMADEDPLVDESQNDSNNQESQEGQESEDPTVIYEGVCRSDNRDTISDNGDVIASYRTLSLPLRQQEWTEETIPQEGDKIELQRFGYTEYGTVIDRRPSNLGTHILWKYARN